MKCPLFIMNDTRAQLGEETEIGDCIKEGCAWWDKAREQCSELSKIGALIALNTILAEIADKMPHEK